MRAWRWACSGCELSRPVAMGRTAAASTPSASTAPSRRAQALGYSPHVAEAHARNAGTTWVTYASYRTAIPASTPEEVSEACPLTGTASRNGTPPTDPADGRDGRPPANPPTTRITAIRSGASTAHEPRLRLVTLKPGPHLRP